MGLGWAVKVKAKAMERAQGSTSLACIVLMARWLAPRPVDTSRVSLSSHKHAPTDHRRPINSTYPHPVARHTYPSHLTVAISVISVSLRGPALQLALVSAHKLPPTSFSFPSLYVISQLALACAHFNDSYSCSCSEAAWMRCLCASAARARLLPPRRLSSSEIDSLALCRAPVAVLRCVWAPWIWSATCLALCCIARLAAATGRELCRSLAEACQHEGRLS